MKKNIYKILIVCVFILVICVLVFMLFFNRTPYSIASKLTGFKIPTSLKIEKFQDDWNNNPGGDGELFIIFSFQESEKNYLINSCVENNYKTQPINENLPSNFIKNNLLNNTKFFYYNYVIDKTDNRNYKLIFLNLETNKLLVYNIIY